MAQPTKLLIAEDDHFLSSLLKARLEKEGFVTRLAFDGEEVERALGEFRPDLIILDLIMPKISGFEVLESISIDPQFNQVPIVVLSNLGQETDVGRAKELGIAEYFVKARTSIDDIVGAVKRLAGRTAAVAQ